MDGLSGLELSDLLSHNPETSDIPIILISIGDEINLIRKSKNLKNVKKVIQKPYSRSDLLYDLKLLTA